REVRRLPHLLNDVPDAASQPGRRHGVGGRAADAYLAGGRLEQPIDELQGGGLAGAAAAQQHHRLPGAHGKGDVSHEEASVSRFPFPVSRQSIAEPLDLEGLRHAREASAMRNRWSSLVACQRTVRPASERIRRKVSAAYLYEWFMASRSPRARRRASPPSRASTSRPARKCFGIRCRPGRRGSSAASNTSSPSESRMPTALSGAQANRRFSGLS